MCVCVFRETVSDFYFFSTEYEHGKSILAESLIVAAGIIEASAGDQRLPYACLRNLNHRFAARSTSHCLHVHAPVGFPLSEEAEGRRFPGEVEFSAEVTGALVVVDPHMEFACKPRLCFVKLLPNVSSR